MTPTPGGMTPSMAGMTPERLRMLRWEKEVQDRNRPLTDDELNQILPSNGYEIITPPASYNAIRKHHEKL
jgi:splicing factor 3B subunit 1